MQTNHNDRLNRMERDILRLRKKVKKLKKRVESGCPQHIVTELHDEQYTVAKPFAVTIQLDEDEDEYVAKFIPAGLTGYGNTEQAAVDDLIRTMLARLDRYGAMEPQKLGPAPRKQLAVLRSFIQPQG
jgi:hypothetical protein